MSPLGLILLYSLNVIILLMANDFMSDRRPACVVDECNQQFEDAKSEVWSFVGDKQHYYWDSYPNDIVTTQILQEAGQAVLDIGCGEGLVLKNYADRCVREGDPARVLGISAVDYSNGNNPFIKVADVHDLGQLVGDEKWDRVMSKYTLMHLGDPLSVYEQALNAVKHGGTITTDDFLGDEYDGYWDQRRSTELVDGFVNFLYISDDIEVISRFDRRAYPWMPEVRQGIPTLHIRRLAPDSKDIHLPVEYETDGKEWRYVISNPKLRLLHGTSVAFARAVVARKP
jgi:SAM-dependent methyltransferase